MSEDTEILTKMSTQIGELNGVLKTHIDAQDKRDEKLTRLIEGHNKRITSLEAFKTRVLGIATGVGTVVGVSVSQITEFFKG